MKSLDSPTQISTAPAYFGIKFILFLAQVKMLSCQEWWLNRGRGHSDICYDYGEQLYSKIIINNKNCTSSGAQTEYLTAEQIHLNLCRSDLKASSWWWRSSFLVVFQTDTGCHKPPRWPWNYLNERRLHSSVALNLSALPRRLRNNHVCLWTKAKCLWL